MQKGRPLSKITNAILALKKGQYWKAPRGAVRATIASYVYNANARTGTKKYATKKMSLGGRNGIVVTCA